MIYFSLQSQQRFLMVGLILMILVDFQRDQTAQLTLQSQYQPAIPELSSLVNLNKVVHLSIDEDRFFNVQILVNFTTFPRHDGNSVKQLLLLSAQFACILRVG
jgi:hypothetical protein